ncbi:MAG: sialidase family protein, partial [Candidatus Thermoplasmatota archaeon]|nr:sialidase family protein [Candidatus Thermoplasmatota archaeon]
MHRILLLALLLTTVPLVGCIGADGDELTENAADTAQRVADQAIPGNAAVLHRAGGERAPLDVAGMLGEGIPLPSGTLRSSGEAAFEPTLGVTSDGTIFLSSFDRGDPGDYVAVRRSTDDGLTWEDVTPSLAGASSYPPTSNDPYVYVDEDTDRVFISDLQALMCSTLAFSDDGGESWTPNPIGCGQPFGVHDHQTVFSAHPRTLETVGYEKVVYYCINRVADSACATSLDGGMTFGPLRPVVFPGVDPGLTTDAQGFCGGLHAHGAAAPDGTVYLPKGHCGIPMVAISQNDGVTWDIVTISEDVPAGGHEVAFATDEAGNAYAFWISDDDLP